MGTSEEPDKKTRDAVYKHVAQEDKGVSVMETPSDKQKMTIINESGMYLLIFGSRLPSARRFKRWFTSEVLPAIRKTDSYAKPDMDVTEIIMLRGSLKW